MNARTLFTGSAVAGALGGIGIVLLDLAQILGDVPRQTVGLIGPVGGVFMGGAIAWLSIALFQAARRSA